MISTLKSSIDFNPKIVTKVAVLVFDSGVTATITCNAFTEKVNIRRTIIRGSRVMMIVVVIIIIIIMMIVK